MAGVRAQIRIRHFKTQIRRVTAMPNQNNDEMGISRYGSRHSKPHPYREVVSFLLRSLSCVHILVKNLVEPSSLF